MRSILLRSAVHVKEALHERAQWGVPRALANGVNVQIHVHTSFSLSWRQTNPGRHSSTFTIHMHMLKSK
jgi:hypothetical protein